MACPRDDLWIKIPNQTPDPDILCQWLVYLSILPYSSALYFPHTLVSTLSFFHHVSSPMIHSSLLYRGCKKTPIHRECCFGPKHGVVWCHSCTAAHSCVVCKHSTTDPRYPLVLSMAVRVWWKRSTGSDDGFYF